jgi:hypothetical protein
MYRAIIISEKEVSSPSAAMRELVWMNLLAGNDNRAIKEGQTTLLGYKFKFKREMSKMEERFSLGFLKASTGS